MIELEKTFLARYLPKGFEESPSREIVDMYYPKECEHPRLRLRKSGDIYEMTKKEPMEGTDSSRQLEQTIKLLKEEYEAVSKLPGKLSDKIRYYYPYKDHTAEITVFRGELAGLILIDFEFQSVEEMNVFEMPDFCLADVTQENFVAGGMLAGRQYKDLKDDLARFHAH